MIVGRRTDLLWWSCRTKYLHRLSRPPAFLCGGWAFRDSIIVLPSAPELCGDPVGAIGHACRVVRIADLVLSSILAGQGSVSFTPHRFDSSITWSHLIQDHVQPSIFVMTARLGSAHILHHTIMSLPVCSRFSNRAKTKVTSPPACSRPSYEQTDGIVTRPRHHPSTCMISSRMSDLHGVRILHEHSNQEVNSGPSLPFVRSSAAESDCLPHARQEIPTADIYVAISIELDVYQIDTSSETLMNQLNGRRNDLPAFGYSFISPGNPENKRP